jgi:hypothetical protein
METVLRKYGMYVAGSSEEMTGGAGVQSKLL